ncbi:MAG: MotA/TolQ/ExbB proton channel family protein [Myxococcales bacterium]|nr:MotA/TolQ/ExbB proton channel family protein [Myxococcales bacterium]
MNVVNGAKAFMLNVGAAPIMYLMLALSVASIAVIVERGWYFFRVRGNVEKLAMELEVLLSSRGAEAARQHFQASRSAAAHVVAAGLGKAGHGVSVAREAMNGARAIQRVRLERGLAYLGTLGSNAPFVGLLGTVVGIIMAFEELGASSVGAAASGALMSAIAEALVATAIGLAVAIPAIVAFNYFQRRIKAITADSDALASVLVTWIEEQRVVPSAPPSGRPSLCLAHPRRTASGEV